jgi:hypothetical protein
MTDSIKTTLNLRKMAPLVRKDIPGRVNNVIDLWGECSDRYPKPSTQKSAMAATQTTWLVQLEKDPLDPELGDVPSHIEADLNIPNAMVGHNLEHGTSVFAAGVAALELLRIWMAQHGLPKDALDLLTTEDVSLSGVTITYLLRFPTPAKAKAIVDAMEKTREILNPKGKSIKSTNLTVNFKFETFTITAYDKTNLEHCRFPQDAPKAALIEATSCLVRVEVKLGLIYLKKIKMVALESWRDAYEKGVYESIFNNTVRKQFRLELRHKAPRQEVYDELTPTENQLLRGYLEGKNPRRFKNVSSSTSPSKRFSDLRRRILSVAKIDIDIPWVDHVKLRCFELDTVLKYPGNYQPSEAHAPWCFCKENWPNLRDELQSRYKIALNAAILKQGQLHST